VDGGRVKRAMHRGLRRCHLARGDALGSEAVRGCVVETLMPKVPNFLVCNFLILVQRLSPSPIVDDSPFVRSGVCPLFVYLFPR
jgi:hypothetical protein